MGGRGGSSMRTTDRIALVLSLLAVVPGCGETAGNGDVETTGQAIVQTNGPALNGISLNGVALNGVALNGVALNGTKLNGVALNGTKLNGVASNGVALNGVALNGATMTGTLANGLAANLKILSIQPQADPDIYYYFIEWQNGTTWQPICGTDAQGGAIPAV